MQGASKRTRSKLVRCAGGTVRTPPSRVRRLGSSIAELCATRGSYIQHRHTLQLLIHEIQFYPGNVVRLVLNKTRPWINLRCSRPTVALASDIVSRVTGTLLFSTISLFVLLMLGKLPSMKMVLGWMDVRHFAYKTLTYNDTLPRKHYIITTLCI